jgi:hypothetical protein
MSTIHYASARGRNIRHTPPLRERLGMPGVVALALVAVLLLAFSLRGTLSAGPTAPAFYSRDGAGDAAAVGEPVDAPQHAWGGKRMAGQTPKASGITDSDEYVPEP